MCDDSGCEKIEIEVWKMYIEIILSVIMGYLIGSIPFALVVGKVFFRTDVREHGSHNLGGCNTGRVLGKGAGLAVMTLDLLKATVSIYLASHFENAQVAMIIAGLAAAIGHCFPLFAGFKGGKAVAALYGFLFGMGLFTECSMWTFFLPLIVFVAVLFVSKIVSLSSICGAVSSTIYIVLSTDSWLLWVVSFVLTLIVIVRHKANILRMIHKKERKISWM